jgi:hypothetical protein
MCRCWESIFFGREARWTFVNCRSTVTCLARRFVVLEGKTKCLNDITVCTALGKM